MYYLLRTIEFKHNILWNLKGFDIVHKALMEFVYHPEFIIHKPRNSENITSE
jgi:hypothetical protein